MAWKGPYEEGVTQSLINRFLVCPYRFYIYTMLGLDENKELHPNLIWGSVYHKGLEYLIKNPKLSSDFTDSDWEVVDKAVDDCLDKDYPNAPVTYRITIKRMLRLYDDGYKERHEFNTEVVFKESYKLPGYGNIKLRGMADGLSLDKSVLVEHKCKGKIEGQLSRLETPVDFQVQLYCLMLGPREVIYDLIRIPEAQFFMPKRRVHEKIASYANSLIDDRKHGDFPVGPNKHLWLDQHTTFQDDVSIEDFTKFSFNPILVKLCKWWDRVNEPGFDMDNPDYYDDIFYRTPIRHFNPSNTEKFRCDYHELLSGACTLDDLVPVKSYFSELEDD